ncbi:MAG: hypothetical protein Q8O36_05185, partial [Candidatus Omnitrophota bacterium]|nr:hypothetical protein [Candidatus Omnitrophota bacterium]
MPKSLREKISEVLISKGWITKEKLDEAIKRQHEKGGNLSEILLSSGLVKENDLLIIFSQELN